MCEASRRRRSEGALPAAPPPEAVPLDEAFAGVWLAAQPIVRASTRSLYAYELLLRSSCAALSSPGAILGAAERANRLPELARIVRGAAARRAAELAPDQRLFVNLHPRDVVDPTLLRDDDPLLPWADRVTLEVTERDHLEGVPGVDQAIRRLREAGYRIAVDDLGAGYSGLTSLVEFAPDSVKLDMSLIRGIDHDRTRARLVRAMFQLCGELDIEVIAEGVETASERDTLRGLGCDLLQGYLYARPGRGFPEVDPTAWGASADER
ncbi:MAG: EAL domain-containing protein [Myxococcota bacterium]